MRPLIHEVATAHTPESLVEQLRGPPRRSTAEAGEPGVVLLRSGLFELPEARYSFVAARPFLTFRSFGSRCEILSGNPEPGTRPSLLRSDAASIGACRAEAKGEGGNSEPTQFGNPWHVLDALMSRYELLDELDLPFPLGGCFGYWGYGLKNFVEPKLPRRAIDDLELPDCHVGFYDSLVVFDHRLGKAWIISTGLNADGSRSEERANSQFTLWQSQLTSEAGQTEPGTRPSPLRSDAVSNEACRAGVEGKGGNPEPGTRVVSNFSRADFIAAVDRAQAYIRAGHIYQVNLSQRLATPCDFGGWELFQRLTAVSPAPFAAFVDCGDFQIASSSPEQFLRLSGSHIQTRPIKGTRPRSNDPNRDAQLTYELQTSAKEMAELVMITDLLRNDLGKVCEFGSIQVPELVRLERYPQVQHLVSTVDGRLRPDVTHFAAFASCFPGGSITGAPKFRAMEIIDELEPIARGPYTGALGYLGFNRESQLSIIIRTALCKEGTAYFNVGAGIVADSNPEAEYAETLAKARGFLAALNCELPAAPLTSGIPADSRRDR